MEKTPHTLLKNIFGYDEFRPLQKEIIDRTLAGRDSLVLMPTGGGKSMCYQIPALIFNGITIVVSPLISLMKDQVQSLRGNGIKADYFNSSISAEEETQVIDRATKGEIQLLYLSPEKLISVSSTWLKRLNIKFVAIDEAHCVSMWGHDFRPEYTQLKTFRKSLPGVPFMALTATADKSAREDIEKQLGLKESKLFISSFDRENLSIEVRGQVPKKQKLEEIKRFLARKKDESGIIYCLSRKSTEEVASYLKANDHSVAFYHAGLDAQERERVQNEFITDHTKIIVATIAFGMGIDKSNVRWVIHYNLPKNLEGYYQEIGRAGRDGLPSETRLYYNMRDFMLYSQFAADGANSDMQKEKLNRMLQFAEAKSCRRKILLSYFGEHLTDDCGNCDVCLNPPEYFDGTMLAQKALSGIARMKEKEGITMLINVLRGSYNAELLALGYNNLKTYGVGKEVSFTDWRDYVIQLANQGLIEIMYSEGSALKITPLGWEVLKGERKIKMTSPVSMKEKKMQKTKAEPIGEEADLDTALLAELKALRSSIARKESVPAYIIFSDKSLKAMASRLPVTENAFLAIPGVGVHKMDKYGVDFIEVIAKYKSTDETSEHIESVARPKKVHTTQITLEMYQEGLSPEEIAVKRNLKITTIQSHLAQLFADGKPVQLEKMVEKEVIEKVRDAFYALDRPEEMKPIFEHLEESVPYGEIRMSLAILLRDE